MSPAVAGTVLADVAAEGTSAERREAALGHASSVDDVLKIVHSDYRLALTPFY